MAMAMTTSGRMGMGRKEMGGGGRFGGGPKRGEGKGGRDSEGDERRREESDSDPTGRVHAVKVVDAEIVVGVKVDVAVVTRAVEKSPNCTVCPPGSPSALDAAICGASSGSANLTLRHGTSDRGRRFAIA